MFLRHFGNLSVILLQFKLLDIHVSSWDNHCDSVLKINFITICCFFLKFFKIRVRELFQWTAVSVLQGEYTPSHLYRIQTEEKEENHTRLNQPQRARHNILSYWPEVLMTSMRKKREKSAVVLMNMYKPYWHFLWYFHLIGIIISYSGVFVCHCPMIRLRKGHRRTWHLNCGLIWLVICSTWGLHPQYHWCYLVLAHIPPFFRTLNALYISPGIPVIYYSMLYYVEFLLTISACMNLSLYRISTVRRMLDYI